MFKSQSYCILDNIGYTKLFNEFLSQGKFTFKSAILQVTAFNDKRTYAFCKCFFPSLVQGVIHKPVTCTFAIKKSLTNLLLKNFLLADCDFENGLITKVDPDWKSIFSVEVLNEKVSASKDNLAQAFNDWCKSNSKDISFVPCSNNTSTNFSDLLSAISNISVSQYDRSTKYVCLCFCNKVDKITIQTYRRDLLNLAGVDEKFHDIYSFELIGNCCFFFKKA